MLTDLVQAYLTVDRWKATSDSKMANRCEMISLALELLSEAGLSLPKSDCNHARAIPFTDVSECMDWFYYRTFHSAGLAPNGQRKDEIDVKPNYQPLVRMNAPAWFKRADFINWLCADTTATWHKKMNVTTAEGGQVSVSANKSPNDYSDVFFTWSGATSGSDYPGSDTAPGIPDDIWEFICDRLMEEFGEHQDALIWLSNLE